jgi:hypothetical protein
MILLRIWDMRYGRTGDYGRLVSIIEAQNPALAYVGEKALNLQQKKIVQSDVREGMLGLR